MLEGLRARGIEPTVTVHIFTDPTWVLDLRHLDCAAAPTDQNLCGWPNPEVAGEFVELATELATRFGDLVDEWSTFNEPLVYLLNGYVLGMFPPGQSTTDRETVLANAMPVLRNMPTRMPGLHGDHAADTERGRRRRRARVFHKLGAVVQAATPATTRPLLPQSCAASSTSPSRTP